MRPYSDSTLLRALSAEQRPARNGEKAAADRLASMGLIEAFGPPLEWERKRPSRCLRLTPEGEAEVAKLPKPRSLMLIGEGVRFDCIHEAHCIGVFADEYPSANEAHCPAKCAHRQEVKREARTIGSSIAAMQDHAIGHFGRGV